MIQLTYLQFYGMLFITVSLLVGILCLPIRLKQIEESTKKKNQIFDFSHCRGCKHHIDDGFGYGDCKHEFKNSCPFNKKS